MNKCDFKMSKDFKYLCLSENPDWVPKERNIGEFVLKHMKLNKDKIAQIDVETGKIVTYGMMLNRCINIAKSMKKHGLFKDDIISICSRNRLENYLPILASFFLGIKPTSLDPSLCLKDTIHLLNLTKPRMIFCESESLDLIESALKITNINAKIIVFGDSEKHLGLNSFFNDATQIDDNFRIESEQNVKDVALILFSSGSSGLPKGICITHYSLIYQINMVGSSRPTNRNINFATTYWISTTLLVLTAISKGDTRFICPNFEVEKCLNHIEKYKIETISLSTANSFAFTQNQELCNKYDNSSLKYISIGGGHFGETHLNEFKLLFPTALIVNVYGMTEISGPAVLYNCFSDNNLILRKGVSCGRPLPGIHLKVVDLHTQEPVGPNKIGELKIKSKIIMKGYYQNMKESEDQFDDEGYFSTGDIVYYDKDYCFYVVDRIKHMLKYQSWHVTPASIESILLTHPDVQEAVVTGLPHDTDGEHPAAVVVLKLKSATTPTDIIKYTEERVSDRQRLRGGVKFVTELPKTPSGKLRRLELRQMIINGQI